MPNELKPIGVIDLDDLIASNRPRPQFSFYIKTVTVSFWGNEPIDLTVGSFDSKTYNKAVFTLLLGSNGMGKSSLLRAIIDFLIEVRSEKDKPKGKSVVINAMSYCINGSTYSIERDGKGFRYSINMLECQLADMKFPNIVASTMSAFDKFPVTSFENGSRTNRYNVPYYKYVGPKATDNMFVSKTNSLLQTLTGLSNIKRREQITRINNLFTFLGYKPCVCIQYGLRKEYQSYLNNKKVTDVLSDPAVRSLYNDLAGSEGNSITMDISFGKGSTLNSLNSLPLREIFLLRRAKLIATLHCRLFHETERIDIEYMSSGEFNMLCTVLNIILSVDRQNTLLLLDEPEISQHPNWQLEIIPKLIEVLNGYCCHVLISTHSHFLVSNLPMQRSQVLNIYKDEDNRICSRVLESETYGWSAEEVLLKAFDMATDRSRYLSELIADLLTRISQNEIRPADLEKELLHLQQVSRHLSDVDPMKKVITTIINTYHNE